MSLVEKSPAAETAHQRIRSEKSSAAETETVVHIMRRDEGVPPYRRLRRESDKSSFRARATLSYQLTEQNQTDTLSFRALVEKSPRGRDGTPAYPRPPTRPRGLRAEKSPATKTETVVHVMRRDEGVPPYRRLRRESDKSSFRARATLSYQLTEQNQTDTLSFRALVEKSHAVETETVVHPLPQILARGG